MSGSTPDAGPGTTTTPPAAAAGATAAAKTTADRLTAIDQQVQAALAVSVDGSLLPSLATDLGTLHSDLAQWAAPIRPNVTAALKQAFSTHQSELAGWPVDKADQAALVKFASDLQQVVGQSATSLGQVSTQIDPLRSGIDACLGSLESDSQALSAQLQTDQDAMDALEDQISDDQDEIAEFNEDPMRYLLQSGADMSGVMTELTQLLSSESNQQASLDLLQGVVTAVGQLTDAGGALHTLSDATVGLSTSLVDLQTALAQVGNTLAEIVKQPPLPAILSAQLEGMVSDLRTADGIIAELSGGSSASPT